MLPLSEKYNVLFSFGSPKKLLPGGLSRYLYSFYNSKHLLKNEELWFFLCLGDKFFFSDKLILLPWYKKNLFKKFLSLLICFIFLSFSASRVIIIGSPILYILRLLRPHNTILHHHGLVSNEYKVSITRSNNPLKNIISNLIVNVLRILELISFRIYSKHIFYNNKIKKIITSSGFEVNFLPNFISNDFFKEEKSNLYANNSESCITFIVVGFFVKRKRLDSLYELLDKYLNKISFKLIIAGTVHIQYKKTFQKIIDKLNKLENISLTVHLNVKNSTLIKLYDSADFLLHLSKAEGFPLVAQEALARGCLIIAYTDVVNTVIPNEYIIPLEKKRNLKFFLGDFTTNVSKLNQLKTKAKNYSYQNFKEDKFFLKFNKILEK